MHTLNFFTGLSLGLLIGWFTGLSASPVVAALLALLTPAAITFMSIYNRQPKSEELLRIMGLAFGCIAAGTIGVYFRSNNLLGMTPKRAMKQWADTGIQQADLSTMVAGFVKNQLSQGRSLAELALSMPKISVRPGEDKTQTGSPSAPPWQAVLMSQPDQSVVDNLLDQLSKFPKWDTAKSEAIKRLGLQNDALDWIEVPGLDDKMKDSVLRSWILANSNEK